MTGPRRSSFVRILSIPVRKASAGPKRSVYLSVRVDEGLPYDLGSFSVEGNEVSDSGYSGILLYGNDNDVLENEVSESSGTDLYDLGTGNTWVDNECDTSLPTGLCD